MKGSSEAQVVMPAIAECVGARTRAETEEGAGRLTWRGILPAVLMRRCDVRMTLTVRTSAIGSGRARRRMCRDLNECVWAPCARWRLGFVECCSLAEIGRAVPGGGSAGGFDGRGGGARFVRRTARLAAAPTVAEARGAQMWRWGVSRMEMKAST